jgi:hypothetical protein
MTRTKVRQDERVTVDRVRVARDEHNELYMSVIDVMSMALGVSFQAAEQMWVRASRPSKHASHPRRPRSLRRHATLTQEATPLVVQLKNTPMFRLSEQFAVLQFLKKSRRNGARELDESKDAWATACTEIMARVAPVHVFLPVTDKVYLTGDTKPAAPLPLLQPPPPPPPPASLPPGIVWDPPPSTPQQDAMQRVLQQVLRNKRIVFNDEEYNRLTASIDQARQANQATIASSHA